MNTDGKTINKRFTDSKTKKERRKTQFIKNHMVKQKKLNKNLTTKSPMRSEMSYVKLNNVSRSLILIN